MIDPNMSPVRSATTVIGLGNEFLADDGLGIVAVRKIAERLPESPIAFQELSIGGLELLDHLVGYDRCIIIDAVATGSLPPGTIVRFAQTPGSETNPISSSHQIDLNQVLTLGHLLGAQIPRTVAVYGIEAADIRTFRSELTQSVAQSVPALVEAVCADLTDGSSSEPTRTDRWEILNAQASK